PHLPLVPFSYYDAHASHSSLSLCPTSFSQASVKLSGTLMIVAKRTSFSKYSFTFKAFFPLPTSRAAQKLNLSSKRKKNLPSLLNPQEPSIYPTNFSGILQVSPPPAPPCLLRAVSKVKENPGMGKVKVMMRICPSLEAADSSESQSFLKVDSRKKQLTLYDPASSPHSSSGHRRSATVAVPKIFAFDAVFTQDASQAEVCSGTVAEVIQSVVNGADGCIFCFGQVKLGKTYTMIGKDSSTQSLGIVPCAISWLFKLINERKEKTGTRFSVRVSAVEIFGKDEELKDLLSEVSSGSLQEGQSPGIHLREDPICGTQLQNQSELRAPTAEKAAFFLDAAIAARSTSRPNVDEDERRNSHMLFTLHIYQYRMEKTGKGGMSGGRSRLHLIDLGSCEKVLSKSRDGGGGLCLSLNALGNVIMALTNGAKHVPYRDSKLTMLLRESLGNINCRTTMIAHISDSPANYADSLTTIQLASRIHRMRKKKSKYASSSSGGESSCEEGRIRRPPHLRPFHPRTVALDPDLPCLLSDPEYSSSSEQSCDTVIYVGPGGTAISDRELSDNEGPPAFVPIIPSLNKKKSAKEGPLDRDHFFKCNTFAELQERLECIDGSEEPTAFVGEGKRSQASPKMDKSKESQSSVSPKTVANISYNQEESVQNKSLPKPAPPPSQQRENTDNEERSSTRMPPVGMSHQAAKRRDPCTSPLLRAPVEVCQVRSTLRERCLDRDILRATVTLQQPVELNGEDELVFTVVEELSIGSIVDQGRPSSIISFNSDCSLQALASGSRPVSIISSINDEFDAYTSAAGGSEVNISVVTAPQEGGMACIDSRGSSISSWLSEVSVCTLESEGAHSTDVFLPQAKHMGPEATVYFDSLDMFNCVSSPRNLLPQGPTIVHSSLPRKIKPTSSISHSSSSSSSSSREPLRQEVKQEDPWKCIDNHSEPQFSDSRSTSAQRVVDGCEKSASRNPPSKMPQLRRGATTLGTVPVIHSTTDYKGSQDIVASATSLKFSSLGKNKANSQKAMRKSSLDHKTKTLLPQSALKTAYGEAGRTYGARAAVSEDELEVCHRVDSFKTSSLNTAKVTSSLKAKGPRGEAGQHYGSQISLERCESLSLSGSRAALSRENSGASLGSSSTFTISQQLQGLKLLHKVFGRPSTRNTNANLPPSGRTSAPRTTAAVTSKPGRGTIMGTKQAIRAANSRVSELATGNISGKHVKASADSDSGNDSGVNVSDDKSPVAMLPSPYSKITAPRRPQRYSSGHGSDNSSVLSGELPPAMGRTALFYHSGGSTTGSASSAHDSMSESGFSSSGRAKSFQRRRLIPAPLPDTASLGKKVSTAGQWVDLPPMSGPLKEPFEIKVYEIDDVERLQRRRQEETAEVSRHRSQLMLERRQQQVKEVRAKHQVLLEELEDTKARLMMDPSKWIGEFEVDQNLDKESPEYLEALTQATEELEFCVNLCKARVMMVTCFDISMSTPGTQEGLREVEV
uniref:Kinesin family member 26A n=1 Tax=Maylandia zebra TaxID=106582 RepID=A0A3P9CDN7_9CICH